MTRLVDCELVDAGTSIGWFSAHRRGDFDIHISQELREVLHQNPSITIFMDIEERYSVKVFPDLQDKILRGELF